MLETTLGLEIIEVVEQAAIASAKWMGKGEKDTADEVAVRSNAPKRNEQNQHAWSNCNWRRRA